MAEQTMSEQKLVQYLSEAYGKEKELENALQVQIGEATRPPLKKRLQEHLRETKNHSKLLERRIKQISGSGPGRLAEAPAQVANLAGRAKAAVEGPLDAVRGGTSEPELMLKNVKKAFWNEHAEIANYAAIESLAETVGDRETVKVAKQIRREEERMASFLEKQIPQLVKAVAREEIPAAERRSGGSRRRTRRRTGGSGSSSRRASSSRSRSAGSSRSGSSRSKAGSSRSKSTTSRSGAKSTSSRRKSASSGSRSRGGSRSKG